MNAFATGGAESCETAGKRARFFLAKFLCSREGLRRPAFNRAPNYGKSRTDRKIAPFNCASVKFCESAQVGWRIQHPVPFRRAECRELRPAFLVHWKHSRCGTYAAHVRFGSKAALPPKADIAQHGGNVRFVPHKRTSHVSFDHLVGAP
jgi:hypothetical protein